MAVSVGGPNPGDPGKKFRKRQIRYNSAQGFREASPFDVRTGQDVPLVYDPKNQVALLEVIEVRKDYLICEGLNPYTEKWMDRALVAKPYFLQITPFDGKTIQLADGTKIQYDYDATDLNKRTVTTTTAAGVVTEVTQTLSPGYFVQDEAQVYVRDVISAIRTTVVSEDGSQAIDNTGLVERNNAGQPIDINGVVVAEKYARPVEWVELNSARSWAQDVSVAFVFVVAMEQTGGEDGTSTTPATWRYTVREWEGDNAVLGSDLDPVASPHHCTRPNIGKVTPAKWGTAAYNEAGDLVMISTTEEEVRSVC